MAIRLNKVVRELNIGLQTAVEFLMKKSDLGEVEENPNFKLNDEQYAALVEEFKNDKEVRNQAAKIFPKKPKEKSIEHADVLVVAGRGIKKKEDLELEKDLLADEKELAEHNMLVDLGRNDIGRIAEIGSVSVDKYLSVERFSHVMHIGSTVSGKLRSDLDSLFALDSILPAGTLSGAPKIRACEIINELENNKRGIYGGAIGYIDLSGNLDTCISIRIAFARNNKVFIRSGAGIVADSVPDNEFDESMNKAAAVINALKIADGGLE